MREPRKIRPQLPTRRQTGSWVPLPRPHGFPIPCTSAVVARRPGRVRVPPRSLHPGSCSVQVQLGPLSPLPASRPLLVDVLPGVLPFAGRDGGMEPIGGDVTVNSLQLSPPRLSLVVAMALDIDRLEPLHTHTMHSPHAARPLALPASRGPHESLPLRLCCRNAPSPRPFWQAAKMQRLLVHSMLDCSQELGLRGGS